MYSIETIQQMNYQAGMKASQRNLTPFVLEKGDTNHMPPFPFPNLGDHIPKDWTLCDTLFVDSTGLGRNDELALSVHRLTEVLRSLEGTGKGIAVIETGQFQLHLGIFKRT